MLLENTDPKKRFDELRNLVMNAIAEEFEDGAVGKSYEGVFEWTTSYPSYYDDPIGKEAPDFYVLRLHCYLIGPGRHYEWSGKTRAEVLDKAEEEIKSWLN